MRCRVFRGQGDEIGAAIRLAESAGASWARFGDELFVYASNKKWGDIDFEAVARASGSEVEARKSRLHLVVQKGRTFQREHPEVRVLLDKGRYLVVDIERKIADRIGDTDEPCYRIEPLRDHDVVFTALAPRNRRSAPDNRLPVLVDRLDVSAYLADLVQLVSPPTRYSTSAHYASAASWAAARLTSLGYSTIEPAVSIPGLGTSRNVVALRQGTGATPRRLIIVTAHLDSVNTAGGPSAPAPGADDNASGAIGVLEMARVFAGLCFVHDLAFVLFGGEEQGLHGSRQYVADLSAAQRSRIAAVINMDMIGTQNTLEPTVLLEGGGVSEAVIDQLSAAAATYTSLAVQTSLNPFASDHVPFIDEGLPAVLTIEGADGANDAIHTAGDTLDRVDTAFAMEILKMNTGAVAELAQLAEGEHPCPDCGPPKGGSSAYGTADMLRMLSSQYQSLLAQYQRLHREGRLAAEDYALWQQLWEQAEHLRRGGQVPGD